MSSEETEWYDLEDYKRRKTFFDMVKACAKKRIEPIKLYKDGKAFIMGYLGAKHPLDPFETFTVGTKPGEWCQGFGPFRTYFVDNFKKWAKMHQTFLFIDIDAYINLYGIDKPVDPIKGYNIILEKVDDNLFRIKSRHSIDEIAKVTMSKEVQDLLNNKI